ncbi:MAG: urease accessory protein UreD [Natronomonas sp.]
MSTDSADEADVPPAFREYGEQTLPHSPAFGHGKDGVCDLTLVRRPDGETRLLRDFVRVPYHLPGTLDTDPIEGLTTLCLQEPTGGIAQGDRHSLSVEARRRSRCRITTQSASKVHSMHANYAHLDATLSAESGAFLEYLPGPTIVNEDARCLQTVSVDSADDAVVVVSDVLVPDGLTDHEPFTFDHYHSRFEARIDGELVCADTVDIEPAKRDPRNPATVGEYGVVGTLYVLAPAEDAGALADRLHERVAAADAVRGGASTLSAESGVAVRVLGHRSTDVVEAIDAAVAEIRSAVLDEEGDT